MKNYFEELQEQGIEEIETDLAQIQKLFIEGRITKNQFEKVLIQTIGLEGYLDLMLAIVILQENIKENK